jgi:hypothetical protein
LYYTYEGGNLEASIDGNLGGMKTAAYDKEAIDRIRKLLMASKVTTRLKDSSEYQFNLLRALGITSDSVKEINIKYKYSDGNDGGYDFHNAKPRSNKS